MRKVLSFGLKVSAVFILGVGLISAAEREADSRSKKTAATKVTPQKINVEKKSIPAAPSVATETPQTDAVKAPAPTGMEMAGEQINWYVISSGATDASSTNYQLQGTVGQFAVGDASSASYIVKAGYWQDFGAGGCCILRGNVNALGSIDIADLTYLVNFMFKSGPPPPCDEEGNVNAVGSIDIADLTYLVNFMFKSGPNPPPC